MVETCGNYIKISETTTNIIVVYRGFIWGHSSCLEKATSSEALDLIRPAGFVWGKAEIPSWTSKTKRS